MKTIEQLAEEIFKEFGDITIEEATEMARAEINASGMAAVGCKTVKSDKKNGKREPAVSDEKKAVFGEILLSLKEKFGNNVEIAKDNKLIYVYQGKKKIKIDIIEEREKKK